MNNTELDTHSLVDYVAESNNDMILGPWKHLKPNYSNLFDFDIKFMKQGYNLHNYTNEEIVKYIKDNNYNNHIFHPKQLYNLFNDNIKILICKNDNIWVMYENNYYRLNDFLKEIETYSYDKFKTMCIKKFENNSFTENKLLILVYIGSNANTDMLIEYLKNYSKIETFSLAFCINYKLTNIISTIIKIKDHFTNYMIYLSNETGNDITPSLLVYDEIINKYNFEYIIKVHTKSDSNFLNDAFSFLFHVKLPDLLSKKNDKCSSIGFEYIVSTDDSWKHNEVLYSKYRHLFKNTEFVPGTMFLAKQEVINNVLNFLKENYKVIIFQNMYDNNSINRDCSYVHFMERLFGYL